ncbi:hypothetical protein SCCGRSA3_01926 [Marine Group I thaumarchaeote SCGC RSA3]|uniref:Uncharacterized protein n=2 Tax=Marine Group I TaxID=905826 RepID=A0A081RP08_9ARCH|nr:hypothetical protein AAA799N04_00601 [Marine Group I thaumarchaeote SCGC AAA799-N04]KFM17403.1 hypothetical protein SCCGRSA3_01926 [Marine Group I thaumarchaeote SCGC RSA3]
MSKETYLKGEKRIQAIQIIKTGIGVRMNTREILEQLSKKGIEIGERTLRRLKLEIYQSAGETVSEIYKKHVSGTVFDELLSFEEMERRCWELYYESKTPSEKFRAISQLRLIAQDKMKIARVIPLNFRRNTLNYAELKDDLKEFAKEGDSPTPES